MTVAKSQIAYRLPQVSAFLAAIGALALPWEGFQQIPGLPITLVKAAGAAIILAAALHWLFVGRRERPRTGLEAPIALFAAACLLSALVTVDRAATVAYLRTYATYLLFFYALVYSLRDPDDARKLFALYAASAAATAAVTLAGAFGFLWPALWGTASWPTQRLILEFRDGLPMRMSGVAADFNLAAIHLLVALAAVLFAFKGRIILRAATAALLLAALAVTMSRSGALVAAALLAAWLIVQIPSHRRLPAAGLLLLAGTLILAAAAVTPYGATLLDRATGGVLRDDGSLKGRFQVYGLAFSLVPRYLLLGCGIGASDAAMKASPMAEQAVMTLHSTPFKILLETGLLGAIALLWLIAAVVRRTAATLLPSENRRPLGRAFVAAAAACGAMLLVQPFPLLPLYPFLLGLAFGPIAAARRKTKNAPDDERPLGTVAIVLASLTVVAAAVCNLAAYQRTANAVVQFSDRLAEARAAEDAARWDDAEARYAEARAMTVERALEQRPYRRLAEALVSMPTLQAELALPGNLLPLADAAALAQGRLALARGNIDKARTALAEANSPAALSWLGFAVAEALWRADRFAEANNAYALWSAQPDESRLPEDRKLIEDLRRSAAEDRPDAERALALRRLGRWDEAAARYAAMADANPDAAFHAAVAEECNGAIDRAVPLYRQAAEAGHAQAARRLAALTPPESTRTP